MPIAASVSTRVVSWNDAADSHESVASDALVNVVDVISRPWAVELYSAVGSIIRHNTFVYRTGCAYNMSCGMIALDRKTSDDAGRNTQVYDNIATGFAIGNGSTALRRDHNMVRSGAATGDFVGVPTFQGGAAPRPTPAIA